MTGKGRKRGGGGRQIRVCFSSPVPGKWKAREGEEGRGGGGGAQSIASLSYTE